MQRKRACHASHLILHYSLLRNGSPPISFGSTRQQSGSRWIRIGLADYVVVPFIVMLLGLAALKVWSDLPREAQERLFAASVDDGIIASSLAEFLHDRHPKTSHPTKPTRLA